MAVYTGVNFNNLRKALYMIFFGYDDGACESFDSPKYRYIIPLQGNFDNPLEEEETGELIKELAKNTFVEYWIDRDISLTQDSYSEDDDGNAVNTQHCVANILLRFIGKEAEDWAKSFRHLIKRQGMGELWAGVCNAEKLEHTMPIVPRRINFFGKNSQIAFDVRFKLYYDECIRTNWLPLKGVNFKVEGKVYVDDKEV